MWDINFSIDLQKSKGYLLKIGFGTDLGNMILEFPSKGCHKPVPIFPNQTFETRYFGIWVEKRIMTGIQSKYTFEKIYKERSYWVPIIIHFLP